MNHSLSLVLVLVLVLVLGPAAQAADPDFNAYWHDGKAELDGYQITVSRYGQSRVGQAVAVYVTEPFSESKSVKVEDAQKNPGDTFDAFKLNLVRDFQTGIYDYNTMVSVFVRDADLSPVKISFSSAEWCGHVYEELLFRPGKITGEYLSYFEGETAARSLAWPKDGIAEDSLWILLRGLRGEFVPGGTRNVPLLPGVYYGRLAHQKPAWVTARIDHTNQPESIQVPAGTFLVTLYKITVSDGRAGTFWVEVAYPHRIIRWDLLPDLTARLSGTARLPYWQLHANGDEKYLKQLGLKPTVE